MVNVNCMSFITINTKGWGRPRRFVNSVRPNLNFRMVWFALVPRPAGPCTCSVQYRPVSFIVRRATAGFLEQRSASSYGIEFSLVPI